jgi:hypothetical protein
VACGVPAPSAVVSASTVATVVCSPVSAAPAALEAAVAPAAGAEEATGRKAGVVVKHSLGKITRARRPVGRGEPVQRLQRASH